jgi:hypothetical protein
MTIEFYKDERLNALGKRANVAQFVSFDPRLAQRYSNVCGFKRNHKFESPAEAVQSLLSSSSERTINIRSFDPHHPQGQDFIFGLQEPEKALRELNRLSAKGLYTIINETIDVNDGGVSGVLFGNVMEFAPGETPRCVEGASFTSLPRSVGLKLLGVVYGFTPELSFPPDSRVEFSIHPRKRGAGNTHTIIWEIETVERRPRKATLRWPTAFSRMLGDKAFGLLLAHLHGFHVPRTTVLSRKLRPFSFGHATGSGTLWLRTCPQEPVPGLFPTLRGWSDPFKIMNEADPEGNRIASVLVQDEVKPEYSGAVLTGRDDNPLIEGVHGTGDRLMIGSVAPSDLPRSVANAVLDVYHRARAKFGSIRMEWVYDGVATWVVQLQQEQSLSSGDVIVPGKPRVERTFVVSEGIEKLRLLVQQIRSNGDGINGVGIKVIGRVGVTSHLADILRRAQIPSRIVST